jgi:hypothetical protein
MSEPTQTEPTVIFHLRAEQIRQLEGNCSNLKSHENQHIPSNVFKEQGLSSIFEQKAAELDEILNTLPPDTWGQNETGLDASLDQSICVNGEDDYVPIEAVEAARDYEENKMTVLDSLQMFENEDFSETMLDHVVNLNIETDLLSERVIVVTNEKLMQRFASSSKGSVCATSNASTDSQIFMLELEVGGHLLPAAFGLLPNAETTSYLLFFQMLDKHLLDNKINNCVEKLLVDIDVPILSALRAVWPGIGAQCCSYHRGGRCQHRWVDQNIQQLEDILLTLSHAADIHVNEVKEESVDEDSISSTLNGTRNENSNDGNIGSESNSNNMHTSDVNGGLDESFLTDSISSTRKDSGKQASNTPDSKNIPDCKSCRHCLDKPKYGGPGKLKQRCMLKPKGGPRTKKTEQKTKPRKSS